MSEYWGYHLIADCRSCDIDAIQKKQHIIAFVKKLVDRIDMTPYGEPMIHHFADEDPKAAGYSLVQLIETSSITAHFVNQNGDVYLDIFSCKNFEPEKALAVVQEYFSPQSIKKQFLHRQA